MLVWSWALLGLGLLACPAKDTPAPAGRAAFGVLYGGQIQRRTFLPFELNSAKQRLGFRIEFSAPLATATLVQWEISRPGRRKAGELEVSKPEQRVTELGSAEVARGERQFEQALAFKPGDPLGLWNIRVVVGTRVLLDRPFTVYDPAVQSAALRSAADLDAGL